MISYRLNFIDIDQSYNIPVADTSVKGYMVVRAPKGTAEPIYFPKGSASSIYGMIGIPTADWQDIQEAIDFNNQYGLWISAPAGNNSTAPSYFGGCYLTQRGIFPFYQVADKDELNFQTKVTIGDEKINYLHDDGENSLVLPDFSDAAKNNSFIAVSSVNGHISQNSTGILFNYWGNPNYDLNPNAAVYQISIAGNLLMADDPETGAPTPVGTISGSSYTITGSTGVASFMYMDFSTLVSTDGYLDSVGEFLTTGPFTAATYTDALIAALKGRLQWVMNIEKDTFLAIVQKSPTEHETTITIKDIGYDQYLYSEALNIYRNEKVLAGRTFYPSAEDCGHPQGYYVVWNEEPASHGASGIYKSMGPDIPPVLITSDFRDQYIKIAGAGIVRDDLGEEVLHDDGTNPEAIETAAYINRIMYINASSKMVLTGPDEDVKPKIDNTFNTVTFSLTEEVSPGVISSGGEFVGSLSETGKDSYGSDIYFPNILPDEAMAFVEVRIVNTLNQWTDSNGIYTGGYRIVDRKEGPFTAVTSVSGSRFTTTLNSALQNAGLLGSTNDDDYVSIVREGWTAAASALYDEVDIFMEPTGLESLKEDLYALRANTHKMSTFISTKKLTQAEADNPASIVVTGRLTGTAQYINEFRRKDAYTGKKYWSGLIGAVGTKLAKIIQDKMGGFAPMFTDIGGLGGQLAVSAEKARYEWTQEQQQILDEKGLNTITLTPAYGLMIVNQKTTQDPTNLTDWSYLGHSMAFDRFKREIRDAVMVPQIGKPNTPHYQQMRQQQADAILARRISGIEPIWAEGKIEISSVNTDIIKAQRKFLIRATVKVNIFSEYVELELINVAQTTSV